MAPAPKQPEAPVARTPLVTVSFDAYPSIRIPKAENPKKSRQGKSLQMGRLLTRAEPVYPEEAKQQGVEGAVKVHAIFNREGTVHSLISVSGPPLLVPAAMNAVRRAVSAGLRHLLPYLGDVGNESLLAEALGNYPEHVSWLLPAIDAALASESDEHIR